MIKNKIGFKLIFSTLTAFYLVGCGQSNSFTSSPANGISDKNSGASVEEQELIDMVGEEQILLMNDDEIVLNEDDAGKNVNENKEGSKEVYSPGGLDVLNQLLGALPNSQLNQDVEGGCGNREAHIIKIMGPNGSYVGVGPGNVEVSTPNAYVCVSPNEVLVGVGNLSENLKDAASCSEVNGDKKIYVCQRSSDRSQATEMCISEKNMYVHIKAQKAGEKTYLGQCAE